MFGHQDPDRSKPYPPFVAEKSDPAKTWGQTQKPQKKQKELRGCNTPILAGK
jgi:hypothetical protein